MHMFLHFSLLSKCHGMEVIVRMSINIENFMWYIAKEKKRKRLPELENTHKEN